MLDGRNDQINSEPRKSLCYFSLYIIDYFSIIYFSLYNVLDPYKLKYFIIINFKLHHIFHSIN